MRATTLFGALVAASLFLPVAAPDARACGGCFHPPTAPTETGSVVTDHQMIFVATPQQTTLYDMIKYTGAPSSFAWVLPIRGTVAVGLGSDAVFAALDQVTRPNITPPPYPTCPVPANCTCYYSAAGSGSSSGGSSSSGGPQVTVLSQATVGPYDTVQLQSTNPTALSAWLTTNGYAIPADIQPVIAAYVNDGFDFLALRLSPGQGIQAMRPVSVTSPGAGATLPLRMVAAGTGATVGVTLWVVSGGRLEAQNFQNFTIAPSELVWDWSTDNSNYTTLQQTKEAALGNAAWQTESSLDLSPYSVESLVLDGNSSGFGGGSSSSSGGGVAATSEGYTDSDAGEGGTAAQQRAQDLATLFPGGGGSVRITRMRADLARAALANDLFLQASMDQSQVSAQYQVTRAVNVPVCPNPPVCPCGGFGGTSSGSVASGDDGGGGGGGGGGSGATPGSSKEASGCSVARDDSSGDGLPLVFAGVVAMLVGGRLRKKR
jgi:hypothetical protein